MLSLRKGPGENISNGWEGWIRQRYLSVAEGLPEEVESPGEKVERHSQYFQGSVYFCARSSNYRPKDLNRSLFSHLVLMSWSKYQDIAWLISWRIRGLLVFCDALQYQ